MKTSLCAPSLPFIILHFAFIIVLPDSLKPIAFFINPYSRCISTVPWPISSATSSSE